MPALNAILASNSVNRICRNGLNLYIKNKLTYTFINEFKLSKYCGAFVDRPSNVTIYKNHVMYTIISYALF